MFAVRKLKCCSEALFIHAIVVLGSFKASQAACAMPPMRSVRPMAIALFDPEQFFLSAVLAAPVPTLLH